MAWLPVDQSLTTHRKTLALASKLGVSPPVAVGYLVFLWLWALDNAPDGNLTNIDPTTIDQVAQFHLNSHSSTALLPSLSPFFDALLLTGFVDEIGQGKGKPKALQIHDWEQYGGKCCEARAAHRARSVRARAAPEERRGEERRKEKSRVDQPPPPTPSDDPAALTLDYEGDIHFEEEGDDPETLEQDLDALFPEGWKVKAHA